MRGAVDMTVRDRDTAFDMKRGAVAKIKGSLETPPPRLARFLSVYILPDIRRDQIGTCAGLSRGAERAGDRIFRHRVAVHFALGTPLCIPVPGAN